MHNFKPNDKIIRRGKTSDTVWKFDIVSCHKGNTLSTLGYGNINLEATYILPFEGNEDMVGTDVLPPNAYNLNDGDFVMYTPSYREPTDPESWQLTKYQSDQFMKATTVYGAANIYFIPYEKFDPCNMKATLGHMMRCENGTVVKVNLKTE